MTYLLTIDPGKNTGIALGFYDAVTPYRLEQRWQVHHGVRDFARWWDDNLDNLVFVDEIVSESFSLREENNFAADLTPKMIEGSLETLVDVMRRELGWDGLFSYQQPSDKGGLIGYPPEIRTMAGHKGKTARQRHRFDFLDRFGLFAAGTDNDDSNDAITHALVYLKRAKHRPTTSVFWPDARADESPRHLSLVPDLDGATF